MHVVLGIVVSVLLQQPVGCGPAPSNYRVPLAAQAALTCQPPAGQPPLPPPVCQPPAPPSAQPLPPPPVAVPIPPAQPLVGWEVTSSGGRVAVRGPGIEAVADRLNFAEGRIVLVGRVKIKSADGQFSGGRACIRTADGCVEVGGAPVPVPVPSPVVPCCVTGGPAGPSVR